MKLFTIIFCIFSLYANSLFSQNDADALRYSMLNYGSTARSLGMGNSFGALGADASTLAINPAGIGLYRKSEITISPFLSNRNIESNYLENNSSDNNFKFAFGNFAIIWSGQNENKRKKQPWSFGIAYNKLNDFKSNNIASGNNLKNSLLKSYTEDIGTLNSTAGFPFYLAENQYNDPANIAVDFPLDIDLAWQTFLIDTIDVGGTTYFFNAIPYGGVKQTRTVTSTGGQGEWDFTLGTNIDERLYLGVTLGIGIINYREDVVWKEEDIKDTIPGFKRYSYSTSLNTTGSGINLKLGAIYRPIDALRIGLSIHTPTWYTLTDDYSSKINADLESSNGTIQNYLYSSPIFIPFDYNIKTPFRAITSVGVIAGKVGLVNIEYEYVNYGQSTIKPVDRNFLSDFDETNNSIKTKYTVSHNVKIGGEIRYDIFRFRVGAFQSTTPFKTEYKGSIDTDLSRIGLTGGLGIKKKNYFIDVAYAYSKMGSFLLPYTLKNEKVDGITSKQIDNRFLITIGKSF